MSSIDKNEIECLLNGQDKPNDSDTKPVFTIRDPDGKAFSQEDFIRTVDEYKANFAKAKREQTNTK